MNASQLKYRFELANPDSHFFSRENMRFAGDRMTNYGVRAVTVQAWSASVDPVSNQYILQTFPAWELYRKRPVKCGLKSSVYFHRETFAQLHGVQGE